MAAVGCRNSPIFFNPGCFFYRTATTHCLVHWAGWGTLACSTWPCHSLRCSDRVMACIVMAHWPVLLGLATVSIAAPHPVSRRHPEAPLAPSSTWLVEYVPLPHRLGQSSRVADLFFTSRSGAEGRRIDVWRRRCEDTVAGLYSYGLFSYGLFSYGRREENRGSASALRGHRGGPI